MSDLKYDFLDNSFTTYESVKNPKVELNLSLSDKAIDISDWAVGFTNDGTPVVRNNLSEQPIMTVNNERDSSPTQTIPIEEISPDIPKTKIKPGNLDNNAREAYTYLVSKGIPKQSAAGIVGNLYHENLRNPLQTVPDSRGTTAYGIAGFNSKGDLPNLISWSRRNGIQGNPDFHQQLDYIVDVINTRPKLTVLKDSSLSAEQASFIWGKEFERFAGKGGKGYLNINDPEHRKRAGTAKSILERYKI